MPNLFLYSYLETACNQAGMLDCWEMISAQCAAAVGDIFGMLIDAKGEEIQLPPDVCLPKAHTMESLLQFIEGGRHVVLVAGRCQGLDCNRSKGRC